MSFSPLAAKTAITGVLLIAAILTALVLLPLSTAAAGMIFALKAGKRAWQELAKGIRDTWA